MARGNGLGQELTLSASAISTWLACNKRYDFRYEQELEQIGSSPPLERGIAIHEAVQNWWAGQPIQEALDAWRERMQGKLMPGELVEWEQDYEHIAALLARYADYYTLDPSTTVVSREFEVNAMLGPVRVVGYVDLVVVMMGGKMYAVEVKSARDLKRRMAWLDADVQPVLYYTLLREMGMPVEGVLFDGIRTYPYKSLDSQDGAKLFQRQLIVPSEGRIAELRHSAGIVSQQIAHAKSIGFVRNLGSACNGCEFKSICHAEVEKDVVLVEAYRRTRYKPREKREEEK